MVFCFCVLYFKIIAHQHCIVPLFSVCELNIFLMINGLIIIEEEVMDSITGRTCLGWTYQDSTSILSLSLLSTNSLHEIP